MKKIVIAGASVFGLNNLSDDSMFSVFCRDLHRNIENLEITLLARHPSPELDEFFKVKSIRNLEYDSKQESVGRWFRGLNPNDPNDHLKQIWEAIKECDLLVIGGEPFIDISLGLYRGPAPYASLIIALAKFLGKPVMINGIHIGRSLTTETGKELTRFCITNADLVTIREEFTRPLLQEMGITNTENIVTLSDAAYGLDPSPGMEMGMSILEKEGITPATENLIGVTFRHMYWKWDDLVWDRYSSEVAQICDHIIEEFDADVLFVPHNTYTLGNKYENDFPSHADICEKIKRTDRAHQITTRLDVYETISLFPLMKMVFSNRRHSLIFGAIHGVPGLGVGEKLHVQVTMEELGIGGDLFVDIENFNPFNVINNINHVWQHRQEIAAREMTLLPPLRVKAQLHAKMAADLLL